MITPLTFTGCPESLVGVNFDARAAATAAACSSGWPDIACAEITFPFSSINTWTCTAPAACALLAIGGYGGVTRCTALPLSTPPEIGACGVGLGGGGGGSSAITTFAGPLEMIWPVPAPGAIGATAFELPLPTIVTTPLRTGGTSLAFDSIVFGTRSARSTVAINSLRTSTFL